MDGSNECGLRHSYRITSLNLGIQGVSISTNVIWAIGFAQGQESIGIEGTTNVIMRTSKINASADLEFYFVDFKGAEAGNVADRQTVLKMISFNDN